MFIKTEWVRMFALTSRKQIRILIAVAFLSMVLLLLYIGMSTPELNYYSPWKYYYESKKFNNDTKTILLATRFFHFPTWQLPANTVNETFFKEQQCPHTNCLITTNRKHLPSISLFDALVFHTALPFPENTVPSTRSAEQIYLFAVKESPVHTYHNLDSEKDFYNITMTYRLDSDILWSYGLIRDIKTKEVIAPALKPQWKSPPDIFTPDEALKKRIEGKTKKAAWFVSRCNANSKRENLAKGIQSNFALDIYGKCGNLSCPRTDEEKCYDKLDTDYKFYLAFENSLCEDYVTEKLYKSLERDIIPIVYGGADYNRFAPPNSYINANNFPTTSALVKYLKYVDSNQTEYNKYFWWKKHYEVSIDNIPFCQICTILNKPSEREEIQIYKNIRDWWSKDGCNITRKIYFD